MLRRGQRRRWFLVWCGGIVVALGILASGAWAVFQPISAMDNAFTGGSGGATPTYNADQGDIPSFHNNGPSSGHNVTATVNGPDGQPLFRSGTISPGSTVSVQGVQYLTPGNYSFTCTIHPTEMHGTLHVTTNGVALARPHATLAVRTKTISKALKKGLLIAINMSAKTDGVSLLAKLGKATIGKANDISTAAGQQFAVMKLTMAGKSKLRRLSKASVTVTATVPFGSPSTAKAKLK